MEFFFCEKCGARITDQDIEAGKGRNKKLRGVFCTSCATGVMTLEEIPLSDNEAKELLKKEGAGAPQPSSPPTGAGRTSSRAVLRPARSERRPPARKKASGAPFIAAACVAGLIAIVALSVAFSGNTQKQQAKKRKTRTEHTKSTKNEIRPPPKPMAPLPNNKTPVAETKGVATNEPPVGPSPAERPTAEPEQPTQPEMKTHPKTTVESPQHSDEPKRVDEKKKAPLAPTEQPTAKPKTSDPAKDLAAFIQGTKKAGIANAAEVLKGLREAPDDFRKRLTTAVDAWEKREKDFRKAIEASFGKTYRWSSKRGSAGGKLVAMDGDDLVFERDIIINGKRQGATKSQVQIADLPEDIRQRIFPVKIETEDAWFAEALHDTSTGALTEAESALAHCQAHPLHAALKKILLVEKADALERDAPVRWEALVASSKKKLTQKQAKGLLDEITAFAETYGKTKFVLQPKHETARARLRREIAGLASGLDSRIVKLLHGKIHSFDARTREIVLEYDCRDPHQTQDFVFIRTSGDKWNVTKKPGRNKEGLRLSCVSHWERSNNIQIPMLHSADFTARIRYKDLRGFMGTSVRLSFYQARAKGSGSRISFLAQNEKHAKTFSFRGHPWGGAASAKGDAIKEIRTTQPLPKSGELEMQCKGGEYSVKVNGRLLLKHTGSKPANRNGITLGGNGDTHYTITRVHLQGKLDARWLKKALEKQEESKR